MMEELKKLEEKTNARKFILDAYNMNHQNNVTKLLFCSQF